MAKLIWQPLPPEMKSWLYAASAEEDQQRGVIGHLRGDFGHGNEFFYTWFNHQAHLNSPRFRREFDTVVNDLRKSKGLLHDFATMRKGCVDGTPLADSFGFYAESARYEYCLRCIPQRGDYHWYLYVCDKQAQREQNRISVMDTLQTRLTSSASVPSKKHEMER